MITVVIPVYNEERSLALLHGELDAVFRGDVPGPVEFLFVDDGSRDGSWRVLSDLAARDPRVHAIRFRRNFGKAAASPRAFARPKVNRSSLSMPIFRTIRPRFPGCWPGSRRETTS